MDFLERTTFTNKDGTPIKAEVVKAAMALFNRVLKGRGLLGENEYIAELQKLKDELERQQQQ